MGSKFNFVKLSITQLPSEVRSRLAPLVVGVDYLVVTDIQKKDCPQGRGQLG